MTHPLWPPAMGDWEVVTHSIAGLTSVTQILPANPSRWGLLWGQPQSTAYRFGIDPATSGTLGIIMNSSTNPILLDARDFPPLIGQPWYAASVGAATGFTLIEVIYRPSRSKPSGMPSEGKGHATHQ